MIVVLNSAGIKALYHCLVIIVLMLVSLHSGYYLFLGGEMQQFW